MAESKVARCPQLDLVVVYALEFPSTSRDPNYLRNRGWVDGPFAVEVTAERGTNKATGASDQWRLQDGVLPRVGQILYAKETRFHVDLRSESIQVEGFTLQGLEILALHEDSWPGLRMLAVHCHQSLPDCDATTMKSRLSKARNAFKKKIRPGADAFGVGSPLNVIARYTEGATHDQYVWLPFVGTCVRGAQGKLNHGQWGRFADLSFANLRRVDDSGDAKPTLVHGNWRVSTKAPGILAEHRSQSDPSGNFHSIWADGFLLHWAEVTILERLAADTASLGDPADSAAQFRALNKALRVFRNRWWWREYATWEAANATFRSLQTQALSLEKFEALQADHDLFISAIQADETRRFNRLAVYLSIVSGIGAVAGVLALFSARLTSGTTFQWLVILSLFVTVSALVFYSLKGENNG